MALISKFYELAPLAAGRPHALTECSWRLASRDGQTLLQLDTYGSATRKDVGTISQSIQIDEATAQQLVSVLRATFPSID